ncbi:MAG: sulfatase-like hydrolase/transferase [Pseudomonadales bacterium]|jgi:arylsulfatase A-like enzyme|nr:sulfatase-like hydrolase/transferase [Pseudomonadales bacterium]MDP6472574.1 sulfatase-like hydrolase/transferase [Pseudomonadales bacterium]MDP6829056.1 sulfatase-like hydrolase/transferase [Pseudomonadales bacterium]MDP6971683.1 sulfatase-like hydrolase/transferase [Pseudomonadales bacterium]
MKKLLIIATLLIAAGVWAFTQYWYYLPGIISGIVDPVSGYREVEWQTGPTEATSEERPPNIVLIVADDLGFNDITFYGGGIANGSVPTFNIDTIAAEGIHFTNGYAGNGTCAPSRAALLTGRFATRSGFEFTPARPEFAQMTAGDGYIAKNAENYPPSAELGLPGSEVTLPELLQQRGYHSVALGKWHLGEAESYRPLDQGFDEFLGFLPGAAMFLPEDDPNVVNSKQDFDPIDRFLWPNLKFAVRHNNSERFHPDSHMTDYFSRHAVKVIEANRNRPFFLYLAYNAPHTPLQAEKADFEALAHIANHTERTYAAMLRGLDRGIGQVLESLEDNGITDNTIVIFTSDNGGAGYVGLPDLNKPYRGWKITFFEGGIHAPYFMRWPERIPAGSHYDSAVAHIDIFSTALAAAGVPLPEDRTIDGVDLLEYALADSQPPLRRPLFWRTGGYKVVQQDGWKLQLQEQNGKTWLYNLNEDPTERNNLSASHPDRLAELKALLYNLDEQMVEPLWPALVQAPIVIDYTIDKVPETDHETIIWTN